MNKFFGGVEQYCQNVKVEVGKLIERLDASGGKVFDTRTNVSFAKANLLSIISFGQRFEYEVRRDLIQGIVRMGEGNPAFKCLASREYLLLKKNDQ